MDIRYQIIVMLMLGLCVSTLEGMVPEQTDSGFILTPLAPTENDNAVITIGLVTDVDASFDNSFGFSDLGSVLVACAVFSLLTIPIRTPSGISVPMIQALMVTPDTTEPAIIPETPSVSTVIQVPGQPGPIIMIPSPPAPSCNACPTGYSTIVGYDNGKCFKYVNDMVLCDAALNDCNNDFNDRGTRAKLWEPDTEQETRNVFNALVPGTFTWTGARERNGNAAAATYPDGSALADFATPTDNDGCNNNPTFAECISILNEMDGFKWCYRWVISDNVFGPYVCQIERNSCP